MPRSRCSSPPSSSASPWPTSSSGTSTRPKAAAGGHLEPGFVTTGLFRLSRHPNFFFEQAQWWAFYAIGATAAAASGSGLLGRGDQLDDRRRGAADVAVHRLDDLHRVDHRRRSTPPTPTTGGPRRCSCRCPRGGQRARRSRPDGPPEAELARLDESSACPATLRTPTATRSRTRRGSSTASSSSRGTSRRW